MYFLNLNFRYGCNSDVVSLAFLSQQFPHFCLPCPGGKPGPGRLTVVPVQSEARVVLAAQWIVARYSKRVL